MTGRLQPLLFWSVVGATLAVYLVMVLWSLPRIADLAGGLAPFDLRPFGYVPEEARAFLAALTSEGRDFYISVQHRLDLAFPGLLALMLVLAFNRLVSGWVWLVLSCVAVLGAGFDWAENAAVGRLLLQNPTDSDVAWASRLTLAKSACITVAMTALLLLLVRAGFRRLSR